jgi:hypothetical protein
VVVADVEVEGVWSGRTGELSNPPDVVVVVVDEAIGCVGVLKDEAVNWFVVGEVVRSSISIPSSSPSSAGNPAAALSALFAALSLSLFLPGNFSGLLGPYLASCCKNIDLPSSVSISSCSGAVDLSRKAGSGCASSKCLRWIGRNVILLEVV